MTLFNTLELLGLYIVYAKVILDFYTTIVAPLGRSLMEVEITVNSQALRYISTDNEGDGPLTHNHVLLMRTFK